MKNWNPTRWRIEIGEVGRESRKVYLYSTFSRIINGLHCQLIIHSTSRRRKEKKKTEAKTDPTKYIWHMVHAYLAFITHLTFANDNNNKFNSQVLQHN